MLYSMINDDVYLHYKHIYEEGDYTCLISKINTLEMLKELLIEVMIIVKLLVLVLIYLLINLFNNLFIYSFVHS